MTIETLQQQQSQAIANENYELAGQLKSQIEKIQSAKVEKPTENVSDDKIRTTIEAGTPPIESREWLCPVTGKPSGLYGAHRMDTGQLVGGQLLASKNIHTREQLVLTAQAAKEAFSSDCEIVAKMGKNGQRIDICLLYTSPSPRDATLSRMPSSA